MSASSLPAPGALAGRLLYRGRRVLRTVHGALDLHIAQNLATGAPVLAVASGDLGSSEPLLARIHSSCLTSEGLGGCDCDCVEQLDAALAHVARAGRGLVLYLMQEGRGAGLAAKARDRMLVQASGDRLTTFEAYAHLGLAPDLRRYDEVGEVCRLLGVRAPLRLLTGNPEKLAALRESLGVELAGAEPLASPVPSSPHSRHYLAAKSSAGHRLAALDPEGDGQASARLPEPIESFAPYLLPDAPRFVHLATYWLPVRACAAGAPAGGGAGWFRLHAYVDLRTGADAVVLAHGARDAPEPLVRVQHESLLERFPVAGGGALRNAWRGAARRIVGHGSGYVAFVSTVGFDEALEERPGDEQAAGALLGYHLRGRPGRPIRVRGADSELERRAAGALPPAGGRWLEPCEVDPAEPGVLPRVAGRSAAPGGESAVGPGTERGG